MKRNCDTCRRSPMSVECGKCGTPDYCNWRGNYTISNLIDGDIFCCTKCEMYFVLPSCCDHYRDFLVDKLQIQNNKMREVLEKIADNPNAGDYEFTVCAGTLAELKNGK